MSIAPHLFLVSTTGNQAVLRIMQTTDLHAHVLPYDYYNDRPLESAGLARTAALIAAVRAETPNCLLLDNGDLLQGSPLGDYMAYDRGMKDGDLHPVIAALNTLRYDAATLGNHEFNFGLPFLQAALARSEFPFVSANALTQKTTNPRNDKRLLPPYVLLDRKLRDGAGKLWPIRIGVLGLLPPQFASWDDSLLHGSIQSRDMVETAAALIPEMKEAGADIIVVLAHTGIGDAKHHEGMENAARPLARLAGIDALITGHTHMVFPSPQFAGIAGIDLTRGTVDGTPTTMAGFWGSHLGIIDLLLLRDGGRWKVLDSRSEARPIALQDKTGRREPLVKSVPRVVKVAESAHAATLDYMRYPVGSTLRPLNSFFALIKNCPSVQIVCRAQQRFVAEKLADTEHTGLPLLSAAAPFKVGGWAGPDHYTDIPAGPLYQRNIADLYCFPNTICAVRLTGSDVREWLERSAAAFHQIIPGRADQPLLNDAFPSYNFDVIYGITYEFDLSQPRRYSVAGSLENASARRIRNLCYQGEPLDLQAEFVVATNNYRVSTQAATSAGCSAKLVFSSPVTVRNILLNDVAQNSPLDLAPVPTWRFTPQPGSSYVFETSPRAAQFAPALQTVTIEPLGDSFGGFARYRLRG